MTTATSHSPLAHEPSDMTDGTGRTRTALANDAWESLLTAHATLMRHFAAQPGWDNISMREYDVLYSLAKGGSAKRLGELSRIVLLSQPALSRLVDRLTERGLISRIPDPTDARASLLSLTEAGQQLQRQVGGAHGVAVGRALGEALSTAELAQLEKLTATLVQEAP